MSCVILTVFEYNHVQVSTNIQNSILRSVSNLIASLINMNQGDSRKIGRPKQPFHELSVITKRQNAKKLCEELSIEELGFTLEKSCNTRNRQ